MDEPLLQSCMQLLACGDFLPHDDVRQVENPSIDGCPLPVFGLDCCNYAVARLHFPASRCMLFAWSHTPVIVLRCASLIMHD